ncbi:hypothetical protein FJM67_11480 [Maribrevibacterium harenarium]|uniref:Uncharacterized protein n=1 Tax=Maribrevibacterium harenarium TaxID=2589817 RepID=A0A501WJC1_9GAMM|nr:hypothetical protein FJM67_11480 [Maribrevibacterium harenarium]
MSNIQLAFLMMGILLVLMSIRIPIALAMLACGSVGYAFIGAYFGLSGHRFRYHSATRFGVIRPA